MTRYMRLLCAAVVAICSAAALAQTHYGGVLRVATQNDALTLDSRGDPGTGGIIAAYQVQESLVAKNIDGGDPNPGLAESWDVSEDGLTYTFHLRKGVKFHDGTDFDSGDVLYTFQFVTGERPGGRYVAQFGPYIESMEAPDLFTFKVTLTRPWSDFLAALEHAWAFLILSEESVESAGTAYGTSVMVGTGPFRFVSWTPGEELVLERNPDYWNDALPYLDGIQFRLIRDASARVLNVRTGDIDIAYDPPLDQVKTIQPGSNISVVSVPGNPMNSFQMNTSVAPFDNGDVRLALYHAIDRRSLIAAFYGEFADFPVDMVPAWHWLYDPDHVGVSYDPELAKQLLAQAGYGPGNPLSFRLLIGPDSESQELGVILQAMFGAVGANVELWTVESTAKFAIIEGRDGQDPSQYQAGLWAQTLPGSTTDDYIQKPFASAGTLNYTWLNKPGGLQIPELEELINAARTAPNREVARPIYRKAIDLIEEAAVLVPLLYKHNVNLISARVHGLTPMGTNSYPLSNVWVD